MKRTSQIIAATLALGVSAWMVSAQESDRPARRGEGQPPREGGRPGGPGAEGQRPPMSPIMAALDANSDGVIDEKEIANASAALKKLDKNGDGKLTAEEIRPQFRGGPGGPGGGEGRGPGGPGLDGQRGPGGPREGRGPGDRPQGGPGGERRRPGN